MRKHLHTIALSLMSLVMPALSSCDLLDCTQGDVSLLRIELHDSHGGLATALPDTLTITAAGTDSVLLNRSVNTRKILLPLSYHLPTDTFVLHNYGDGYSFRDTLVLAKSNDIYFESPDCPTVMMHTIHSVGCTAVFVDSVKLLHNRIDFEDATHLRLYIR